MARERVKLTQEELGEQCGVTRNAVSQWESGKTTPRPKRLPVLACLFETTIQWLMTGEEPPSLSGHARSIVTAGGELSNVISIAVAATGQSQHEIFRVKEIDVAAASGDGLIIETELSNGTWGFPGAWARQEFRAPAEALRIITIEGDSMAGTLESGDKVLIDTSKVNPSPPGVFILDDGVGLVAKRLVYEPNSDPPKISIRSDNERYESYERTAEEIRIIGRVVGVWRRI